MKSEIEVFRVFCMFGIVWFHSGVEVCRVAAHGGLIFFIIVSVYFGASSRRKHRLVDRVERLLVPCAAWSVFYGIISYVRHGHCFPEGYTLLSMLLATPSIHLWFLPFIFFVLVWIDSARGFLDNRATAPIAGIFAIVLILFAPVWQDMRLVDPFLQYLYALPAVFIGLFYAYYGRIRLVFCRMIAVGIIISLLVLLYVYHSEVAVLYLAGVVPCIFLFYSNVLFVGNRTVFLISSTVYGIYLVHPFWQMFFRFLGVTSYLLPIATFITSMFSMVLLKNLLPRGMAGYFICSVKDVTSPEPVRVWPKNLLSQDRPSR